VEVELDCRARGGQVLVVPTDIADPAAVERLARLAVQRFGQIDVWVEAVAVGVAGPLGFESVDEIRRLVDTNVFGTVLCARAALAAFQAQGNGILVLVGSLLSPAYAPERIAATILACARRPRRQATTGVVSHLALAAHRLAPGATESLVARWSATFVTNSVSAAPGSGSLFDPPPTGAVHGGYRRGRVRRRLGEWLGAAQARRNRPNPG
jgi:NAD(P)-dependent dehydrogenase (short-subunit alcohol dehydrogenase family)